MGKRRFSIFAALAMCFSLLMLASCGGGGDGGGSSLEWSGTKQLGVAGAPTAADSVAVDASGNVYVTGNTAGGLDGNTLTGTEDFFLAKYDSSGNKQ